MVHRGYKFRIYPNKKQEIQLKKTIGCCRYVYNWALELKSKAYEEGKTRINYVKTSAKVTQLRKDPETEWLNEISCVALQQVLRNLEAAFSSFFKKRSRYPKFKKKRNGGSVRFVGSGFSLGKKGFRVNRIKKTIKVAWSREMLSKPSSCTISLNPSGQWFVSFVCEEKIKSLRKKKKKIAIDLGIESFATFSNGTKVNQPDSIRKARRKLARSHRSLSRKKKDSNNRNKAKVRLARDYQKVANIRTDFQQKLSTQLIRENQTIVIEDLAVSDMLNKGNRKLARLISEQSWRDFRAMLAYKSDWYGRELIVIDKYFPSSQICNSCGKINKLSLDKRKFTCECGVTYDRDVNAAQNILAVGTTASACGANVRLPNIRKRSAAKQEAQFLSSSKCERSEF